MKSLSLKEKIYLNHAVNNLSTPSEIKIYISNFIEIDPEQYTTYYTQLKQEALDNKFNDITKYLATERLKIKLNHLRKTRKEQLKTLEQKENKTVENYEEVKEQKIFVKPEKPQPKSEKYFFRTEKDLKPETLKFVELFKGLELEKYTFKSDFLHKEIKNQKFRRNVKKIILSPEITNRNGIRNDLEFILNCVYEYVGSISGHISSTEEREFIVKAVEGFKLFFLENFRSHELLEFIRICLDKIIGAYNGIEGGKHNITRNIFYFLGIYFIFVFDGLL